MNTKKFLEAANLMQTGQSIILYAAASLIKEHSQIISKLLDQYPEYRVDLYPDNPDKERRPVLKGWLFVAYSLPRNNSGLHVVSLLPDGKTATITGVQSIVNKGDTAEIGYTGEIKTDEPTPWIPKRGDFCALKSLGVVFIFDRVDVGGVYDLAFLYSSGGIYFGGHPVLMGIKSVRPATPSEEKTLLDALEKVGKRWNKETLQLEDLPKFKDGDFVRLIDGLGRYKVTGVFRAHQAGVDYLHIQSKDGPFKVYEKGTGFVPTHKNDQIRLATEDEIKTFELELAKAGKMWDKDKKQLVRWRASMDESYKFIDGSGQTTSDIDGGYAQSFCQRRFDLGNYFHPDADTSEYEKRLKDVFKDRL